MMRSLEGFAKRHGLAADCGKCNGCGSLAFNFDRCPHCEGEGVILTGRGWAALEMLAAELERREAIETFAGLKSE